MTYKEYMTHRQFIYTSNIMHEQTKYDRDEEYEYDNDIEENGACSGDCLNCFMNCPYN